jgi:hypothetical protein
MMLLAVIALPALMKFFTWATGSVNSGGGQGLAALAGASAAGIHAKAAFSSGGRPSAASQAGHISTDLGPAMRMAPSGAASAGRAASSTTAGAAAAGPAGMVLAAAPAVLSGANRAAKSGGDAMTGENR